MRAALLFLFTLTLGACNEYSPTIVIPKDCKLVETFIGKDGRTHAVVDCGEAGDTVTLCPQPVGYPTRTCD